ncbi:UNVERIFIED_CONTAM: Sodium-coupled monocarboxylate transporter 1 [Gekko kuhli]
MRGACRAVGGFGPWDYVVFAAMLLISAGIGLYYAFAGGVQKTSREFLMGGRRMSAVPVALSLTASFMSAVTVLGTPAEVYRFGARFSVFAITYALVVVISAEVFLPVFYRLGITSTYEISFGKTLQIITSSDYEVRILQVAIQGSMDQRLSFVESAPWRRAPSRGIDKRIHICGTLRIP